MPDLDPDKTTQYLNRLREVNKAVPAQVLPPVSSDSPNQRQAPTTVPTERRRHPRYRCLGRAELRKQGTTVATSGTLTDISQSGCYVELPATFPPETQKDLVLELNQVRVHAKAVVRVTYPFLGMGLAFTKLTEQDLANLDKLLESIVNSPPEHGNVAANVPEAAGDPQNAPEINKPRAALDALLKHFEGTDYLTREGFWSLLRASQCEAGQAELFPRV